MSHAARADWAVRATTADALSAAGMAAVLKAVKAAGIQSSGGGRAATPTKTPSPVVITGTTIEDGDAPGRAVRMFDPIASNGPRDVWKRDVFNVQLYTATGNGVSDDTTGVVQAIADLNKTAGGGVLYFPTGVYRITALLPEIIVPVVIAGDGRALSRIVFERGLSGFTLVAFDGVEREVRNLGIVCMDGVDEGSGDNIRAEWCIRFLDTIAGGATSCDFTGAACGVFFDGACAAMVVRECEFYSVMFGVWASDSPGMSVVDCFFNGVEANAIELGEAQGCRVRDCAFQDVVGELVYGDWGLNFIDGLRGFGGNADARFEDRRETWGSADISEAVIAPMATVVVEVPVAGATSGDVVSCAIPGDLTGLASAAWANSDMVKISVANVSAAEITIPAGRWRARTNG